jgi:NTP pyrophosphatase (non-canonical NTP hydrolase)
MSGIVVVSTPALVVGATLLIVWGLLTVLLHYLIYLEVTKKNGGGMRYISEQFEEEVGAWADHNFPEDTIFIGVLGLVEEVGEAARAVVKQHQGIRGTSEEWDEELYKELGDAVIKLAHVAHLAGWSLGTLVQDRWDVVKERDFVKDPKGHGLPENPDDRSHATTWHRRRAMETVDVLGVVPQPKDTE